MVTTDGSIEIDRNDYVDAEERVIYELQTLNKPFIVVLNTNKPNSQDTKILKELEDKYNVTVQVMDVYNMEEQDIEDLFKHVLKEFPC